MAPQLSAREVTRKSRRFDRSFKRYRRLLVERHGREFAAQVSERARREYRAVLSDSPRFAGRVNLFNWVVGEGALIIAFHQSMRAMGKTVEDTMEIVYDATERSYESQPNPLRFLVRKIAFGPVFFRIASRSAALVGQHPEGWKMQYRKDDGRDSDWNVEVTECGVLKYFEKHGVPELAAYCNFLDYLQSRTYGMGMINPTNIGQGDAVCLQLMKQGRDTPVPANLQSLADPTRRDAR